MLRESKSSIGYVGNLCICVREGKGILILQEDMVNGARKCSRMQCNVCMAISA